MDRQYKGNLIRVIVLQEGVEYEGRRYKSLTAIAKEVMHWIDSLSNLAPFSRHLPKPNPFASNQSLLH